MSLSAQESQALALLTSCFWKNLQHPPLSLKHVKPVLEPPVEKAAIVVQADI
jgi:hypothetical protein